MFITPSFVNDNVWHISVCTKFFMGNDYGSVSSTNRVEILLKSVVLKDSFT